MGSSTITIRIFIYIYYFGVLYSNLVSTSMTWDSHLLITHIRAFTLSVTSYTTGEYFSVKYTPGILVYPFPTSNALKFHLYLLKDPFLVKYLNFV